MKLDAYLRAHEFMKVERPPHLWEADTEEVPFLRLLGELIAALLGGRYEPPDLVLNASTVEHRAADERFPEGDYVALTVRGPGAWETETRWWPGADSIRGVFAPLETALREAGTVCAYTRNLGNERSATFFLRRLPFAT